MDLENMYEMSLQELITILLKKNLTAIKELNKKPRQDGLFGHNQIAWDLGISQESFSDAKAINKTINQLENEFDLVLMANRMEESLVLL